MEKRVFFCYGVQGFRTEEILKCHINDCFKVNGKQMIQMLNKGEYFKFKIYKRKIKNQKHIACSYGYRLV